MLRFTVGIPDDQVKHLEATLGTATAKRAMYQAVLRTTRAGTGIVQRCVKERMMLDQKYIKRVVRSEVKGGDLTTEGAIIIENEPIPLIAYGDRTAGQQGGVTVIISKNRLPLYLRHAFIATVGKGRHKGIFFRAKGRDRSAGTEKQYNTRNFFNERYKEGGRLTKTGYARRLPIEEQYGPSVVDVFGEGELKTIGETILADVQQTLQKNIQSQMDRFMGRKKGQAVNNAN